jgi:hypothetical protein
MRNPPQGEDNENIKYTTEELRSVPAQYTTSNEVVELHLPPGCREATLSSSKEASSDVVVHSSKEGGKKRRKQCPQGRIAPATHSDKCQARLPTYHFKRLLDEACINQDFDMMKSFMILGCLPLGMELDQNLGRSDTMRFGTRGHRGIKAQVFQYPYIYEYVYYSRSKRQRREQKMVGQIA